MNEKSSIEIKRIEKYFEVKVERVSIIFFFFKKLIQAVRLINQRIRKKKYAAFTVLCCANIPMLQ
jgi:ribosomal protein L23